jgi:DNA replication licensing factor MCM6
VTPDVSALYKAGAVPSSSRAGGRGASEGVGGLKALGVRDLVYTTAFVAQSVSRDPMNPKAAIDSNSDNLSPEEELAKGLSEEDKAVFEAMAHDERVYARLVTSMAPTIRGHEDVKKGMLLMLIGGVAKTTREGAKLRGDINVCIVGDPSTAKSQFLKYTVKFAPKGVYTSGKGSSAAGLTASVVKDPDTGEFAIEAGALMLADSGVCW